jgi:hypothetical protein
MDGEVKWRWIKGAALFELVYSAVAEFKLAFFDCADLCHYSYPGDSRVIGRKNEDGYRSVSLSAWSRGSVFFGRCRCGSHRVNYQPQSECNYIYSNCSTKPFAAYS